MKTKSQHDFRNEWQRVSLLAIVYFFFNRGLKIIKELGLNAAPGFAALLLAVDDKSFWFTIAGLGFIGLIIIDIVALYLTYRYRVEDDQVVVKQGVLTKEVLNMKFARVQNVNNAVPWYFKPFGLVSCSLDSAGSSAKEINIPGVTKERSDAIAAIIQDYQKDHQQESEAEVIDEDASEDVSALKLSNKEITKYGFTNSMIFIFAGAFFPIIEKITETTGIDFTAYLNELAAYFPIPQVLAKIILVAISVLIFAFLLLCVTALGAFVKFHNYELYDEGKKLKRVAGLLERLTIYLNKSKVQGVTIKQNMFARILKRVTVKFQQTSADGKNEGKKQDFIIPMLKPDEWQQQLHMIYPELTSATLEFTPVQRQYFTKTAFYGLILPFSLVILPLAILESSFFLLLYILLVPFIAMVYLRYRRYGYCVQGRYLIIREGIVGTNYHILERFKAQNISATTSPSQRRLGMASLNVQMAYAAVSLPYIKLAAAQELINEGLYLTESTNKAWM